MNLLPKLQGVRHDPQRSAFGYEWMEMKRSFSSKEPAMTAGRAIKKAFPVVVVTLEDTKDGGIETIK